MFLNQSMPGENLGRRSFVEDGPAPRTRGQILSLLLVWLWEAVELPPVFSPILQWLKE